jgi:DNA-binding NarL/FixJ family response regulator
VSTKPKAKPSAAARLRVFIVDDHPMMREGLAQLVADEPDLEVCGEAENAASALETVPALGPDLVLADITLPDKNGLELIKDLLALVPGLKILVISMHEESFYAERVLKAGARGYIMKHEGGEHLMQAIRHVLGGAIHVSEAISARILERFSGQGSTDNRSPVQTLSDREFEVFQLVGEVKTTREIAELLHLSVKTIEVHRLNIKQKLGLKHASELIRSAVRWVEGRALGE